MANHVRRQLREAVTTAVTGLTTTASRVHGYRVYALGGSVDLPALSVYVESEDASSATVHAPAVVERRVTVHVRGFARAASGVEDTLDAIANDVETALAAGVTVSSRTVPLAYAGCDIEWEAGDRPYGAIDLRFTAVLFNTANAPDQLT